jgi:hypothetical protein
MFYQQQTNSNSNSNSTWIEEEAADVDKDGYKLVLSLSSDFDAWNSVGSFSDHPLFKQQPMMTRSSSSESSEYPSFDIAKNEKVKILVRNQIFEAKVKYYECGDLVLKNCKIKKHF